MTRLLHSLLFFLLFLLPHCISASPQDKGKDNKPKEVYKKKAIRSEVKSYNKAENYAKMNEVLQNAFRKYPQAQQDAELMNFETMDLHLCLAYRFAGPSAE